MRQGQAPRYVPARWSNHYTTQPTRKGHRHTGSTVMLTTEQMGSTGTCLTRLQSATTTQGTPALSPKETPANQPRHLQEDPATLTPSILSCSKIYFIFALPNAGDRHQGQGEGTRVRLHCSHVPRISTLLPGFLPHRASSHFHNSTARTRSLLSRACCGVPPRVTGHVCR